MTEQSTTTAIAPSPFVDEQGNPRNAAIKAALDQFWTAVKRLPAYARLAAAMAKDQQIPKSSKALLVAGGAYVVSPIDLVPGVIPVVGQLDDLYVMLTALQFAVKKSPTELVTPHLEC